MAVNVPASLDNGKEAGIQRVKLPVYESYAGTGAHTENFPYVMRELLFSNDSNGDLTVQVLGPSSLNITITVKAYEVLDERFTDFSQIVITGAGAWRFWPRTSVLP